MTDPAAAPHINHSNDPGSLIDLYLYRAAAAGKALKKEKGPVAWLEPGQRRVSI